MGTEEGSVAIPDGRSIKLAIPDGRSIKLFHRLNPI